MMRNPAGILLAVVALAALPGDVTAQVDTAWTRVYNSGGSASDGGSGLLLGPDGFLYLVGTVNITPQGIGTLAIWKYDTDGNLLWTNSYSVTIDARADWIHTAIDAQSNLLVGANSPNGIGDYFVLKANSDGDTIWTRQYNGTGGGNDVIMDLEVDVDGSVVVTGYSLGETPGPFFTLTDVATLKFSAAGDFLWERRANGWSNMRIFDLAIGTDGSIVWSGLIDTTADGLGSIAIVNKYAANGGTLWSRLIDSVEHPDNSCLAIANDQSIYVLFEPWTGYPAQGGTLHDLALIKLDEAGVVEWLSRYDSPLHADEFAVDLALTPDGDPVVLSTARVVVDSGLDIQTMLYDATGQLQWIRRYGEDNGSSNADQAIDLDVGEDGLITVVGASPVNVVVTLGLSDAGVILWQRGFTPPVGYGYPYRVVRDAPYTYVSGRIAGGPTSGDLLTIKYTPCCCACLADPICDGIQSDVTDVVRVIEMAFRGGAESAPDCVHMPSDVDCSGATDIGDVIRVINVAFRGSEASLEYCQ